MAIRLIIADLDQTLIDLKQIHFEALNQSLEHFGKEYIISKEDHIKIYDGLSTKKKLNILSETKGLSENLFDKINNLKQQYTCALVHNFTNLNFEIIKVVHALKEEGLLFYVASNAVRNTIDIGLKKLGITYLVDKIYSNQDVKNPKPNSEIYLRCMADAGVNPNETLIIEDSKHGRASAVNSGAFVCGVDNSFDFTYDRIKKSIYEAKQAPIKWAGKSDLNVLIPMSGNGTRFKEAGFKLPKPLIDINGKPMIQKVVESLNIDANYIFVVQKQHFEEYNLGTILPLIAPKCKIVQTNGLTEGAACSTLLAKEYINNNKHLLIANSDQYLSFDSCDFLYNCISKEVDGSIIVFEKHNDPKWSYAKINDMGYVVEVVEKQPISSLATIGLYYWSRGHDYVKYAEQMISANDRYKNEFYTAPVYNYAIKDNKKIITYKIPNNNFFGLGVPEDLDYFLKTYKEDNV